MIAARTSIYIILYMLTPTKKIIDIVLYIFSNTYINVIVFLIVTFIYL
nr:MAG TPA: hypothetical protein [Caudoviricetes sp.]